MPCQVKKRKNNERGENNNKWYFLKIIRRGWLAVLILKFIYWDILFYLLNLIKMSKFLRQAELESNLLFRGPLEWNLCDFFKYLFYCLENIRNEMLWIWKWNNKLTIEFCEMELIWRKFLFYSINNNFFLGRIILEPFFSV